jgi:hypothetical protein
MGQRHYAYLGLLNKQMIIHSSMDMGNEYHLLGTGFSVHKRTMSVVKRVEFVSRILHLILRGCWCDIVLNA